MIVWIVQLYVPHEGGDVLGVFAAKDAAEAFAAGRLSKELAESPESDYMFLGGAGVTHATLQTQITATLRGLRDLPEWIAWRLDTVVTRQRDRDLSYPVWEAMREAMR